MKDLYEFNEERPELIPAPEYYEKSDLSDESSIQEEEIDVQEEPDNNSLRSAVSFQDPDIPHGSKDNQDWTVLHNAVETVLGKRHAVVALDGREMLQFLELGACAKRIKLLNQNLIQEEQLFEKEARDLPVTLADYEEKLPFQHRENK